MFSHRPSFWRNPRGLPNFLLCPFHKPYQLAALTWYYGYQLFAFCLLPLEQSKL